MRFKYVFVLAVLFCISYNTSLSQIYFTRHYSTENGLPSRVVMDITQDNSGRMWFATSLGVSVYDGFEWNNFDLSEVSYNKGYRKIKIDSKGILWAVPQLIYDSVVFYNNNKWGTIPPPSGYLEINKEVTSFDLYYDNDNPVLCIGTYVGIYIYSDKKWSYITEKDGLKDDFIYSIDAFDKKFYISTPKGITIYSEGKADNSLEKIISSQFEAVLKITVEKTGTTDSGERMWILGYNKLGYIENNKLKILTSSFQLPKFIGLDYYSLVPDKRGNIYFSNIYARYFAEKNTGEIFPLSRINGFAANGGTSIFIDKEDNIWFSDNRGIDKLNNLAFHNHTTVNGLPEDEVSAVNELTPGTFVFGHNSGITIFKNFEFHYIPFSNFSNNVRNAGRVLDLYKDNTGNLWIAASKTGVGKMDLAGNISWLSAPKDFIVSSVINDNKGNILVSSNEGVYVVRDNKLEKYGPFSSAPYTFRKMFRTKDGSIWAAGFDGIFVLKNQNLKHIYIPGNNNVNSVFSVFQDSENRIFAGTGDGLYLIRNDSLIKFNENNFSIDDAVFTINQDKLKNYWFGTENNLVKWNGKNSVREYNSNNGMVPGEINRSAVFFDSFGKLWIGTDAGLSRYFPEYDEEINSIPKVEILGVEDINGKIFPLTDDLTLESGQNTLRFIFRGISFVEENSIEYKIILEGYDKDWVSVNQSQIGKISYKNLSPGDYVFKVKARNNSGTWSNEVSSKKITIGNPYYKKLWFIFLVLLILMFIIYVIYKFYIKNVYAKKLEKKVESRTIELNKSNEELEKVLVTLEERVKERTYELEKSEEKYRSVFEQATEGILIFDLETKKVIQANKAYCEMLGFSETEILQLTLYDIVAHDAENINSLLKKIIERNKLKVGERNYRHKDGSLIPVDVNVKRMDINGKDALYVVVRDMRERKKIEQELRDSEKKFRELVKLLPEGVYETDIDGYVTFVNSAGLNMMGYTLQDIESPIRITDLVIPEEREAAKLNMQKRLKNEIKEGFLYNSLKKDGAIISIYVNAVPIMKDGKCVGSRGIAFDMTLQKKYEDELKEIAEELKQINASKDKFFSVVAHDLRNPFTSVLGFTEILLGGYNTFTREEIRAYAEHIRKSARNTYNLLDNLLQWGRIQTNRIECSPVKLNLHNRVDKVLNLLRPSAQNKEINIIDRTIENTFVKADKHMFQSVMQNLVTNAIKFTNRKGTIEITMNETNTKYKISVTDNGIGISKEILETLFCIDSPNTRAGTEKESGTGLGLIICKDMMEKMGGTIEVESEPNKGSKFTITLEKWNEDN